MIRQVTPYTALADCYDAVMKHVDYAGWADYLVSLIEMYHPSAKRVLELGCGTGSIGRELLATTDLAYYGVDRSSPMLDHARLKLGSFANLIGLAEGSFSDLQLQNRFDAVILIYDGLNYMQTKQALCDMIEGVGRVLQDGGIFLVDHSTPANSINNADFFEDAGKSDDISYIRQSSYDQEALLHTTRFEILQDGVTYVEEHVQRAYSIDDIAPLLGSVFDVVETLDAFSMVAADESSERVQWVLRKKANM